MNQLVIAYEPVWAIGTGKVAQVEDITRVHRLIRGQLGQAGEVMQILYGGSVTADNAGAIFDQVDVDGALVGGASLKPDGFWAIAEKSR